MPWLSAVLFFNLKFWEPDWRNFFFRNRSPLQPMHCLMKTSRLSPIVRKMVGWSFWGKDSTTFNDVSQILRQNKLWLNSFSLFRFTDIFWYHCTYDGVISADACLNSLTWSSSYYRMQSTITVLLSFASHIYVYPLHLFWMFVFSSIPFWSMYLPKICTWT